MQTALPPTHMSIAPTDPVAFWTMVTGLATVALFGATIGLIVAAVRGLHSLKLTRDELKLTRTDMLTRAKRDALQDAMERAKEWAEVVIPANAQILSEMARGKVPVFVAKPSEIRFDPDHETHLDNARAWCATLPDGMYGQCLHLMNKVEAWSLHYTSGLADAEIVFSACAPTFCHIVMQNYAVLLVIRSDPGSGKYMNTIRLFKQWLHMLAEQERGVKQGALIQRLREMQAQGPANPNLIPRPIGTDLDDGPH